MIYCSLSTCAPCLRIKNDYNELIKNYPHIEFYNIVVDKTTDRFESYVKEKLNITKYPYFVLHTDIILNTSLGPNLDK